MIKKTLMIGSLASVGFLLGMNSSQVVAQMTHEEMTSPNTKPNNQFLKVEQPLWVKGVVTAGGLSLIGLELWWFLWSKSRSQKAEIKQGIQEVIITVDGGYEPNQIVVNVGQPVRLNFYRKDPSNCLEEVRFPDFQIAQQLSLNQVTPIEFTPDKPGIYTFSCGMNMFRGIIEVQA
jgi:plastocyanin domain-containing protein